MPNSTSKAASAGSMQRATVAPGPVWTPLNPADQSPEKIGEFGAGSDMQRPAQPEKLSPAYVFRAAPCCSGYISGIVLPVTDSIGGGA